jgi:hypothetical protein
MREDMSRVIVERPRIIDSIEGKGRCRSLEDLPKQQGMRRSQRERGGYKMLNENLAPLRRFLERQVGRPWGKVYSEIAQRLRVDSTVQQHVRDHLSDFVATRPRRGISDWRRSTRNEDGQSLWYQPLYVDPKDGILKRTDRLPEIKARRHRAAERSRWLPPIDRIELAFDRELHCMAGIWYEVALAPLPDPEYRLITGLQKVPLKRYDRNSPTVEMEMTVRRLVTPSVIDCTTGRSIPAGPEIDEESAWKEYRRSYPHRRYAVSKRQLSRKELRRHGVANCAAKT